MKRIATTLLVASLLATPMLALPSAADAAISVGISIGIAPPPLPVYAQPIAPGPGYLWTPGYWAWDPSYGYYWVPGTWVMPPEIGLLWTPGWWGWSDGYYRWHAGYWGTHVGFYGGINYGHGYFGAGYTGGYWRDRHFYYNRAVNNLNVTTIHNVYVDRTVVNDVHVNRVSYNGGHGGITARPTATQRAYESQRHVLPTSMQTRQREVAMHEPAQRYKVNQGRPAVFATQHAGRLEGPHAVRAPRSNAARHENRPAHFVQAPHMHAAIPQNGSRPAPMNVAPNRPTYRNARVIEAPHNQPVPERAPAAHAAWSHAQEEHGRPAPNSMRPPQPRGQYAAPRPPSKGQYGEHANKHPSKDNGGH